MERASIKITKNVHVDVENWGRCLKLAAALDTTNAQGHNSISALINYLGELVGQHGEAAIAQRIAAQVRQEVDK